MKESELKSLVKMVLKEIYMEPEPEHPLAQLFSKLSKAVQGSNPAFVDISKGHEMAHRFVAVIIGDIKLMVKSSVGNQKQEFSKGVEAFEHHTSSLMNFIVGWAQQIHAEHPEKDEQIDRVMHELKDHVNQVGAQFKEVFLNLRAKNDFGKPNVINSMKQLEHLNEIFNSLKESIDALFQIGLDVGYGKKK
jgi:hypothetical protein